MASQVDTVDLVDSHGRPVAATVHYVHSVHFFDSRGPSSPLLDPRFWLLALFLNFSVEMRTLPGTVLTPLWRRKLGLKGTNGS
jgi:hypothetical protein